MSGGTRGSAKHGGASSDSAKRGRATWPAAAAGTAAVTAALLLPGSIAYADPTPPPANQGNTSVASGNQALLPLSAPLNICGVSIAVLGSAQSGCRGGATTRVQAATVGGSNPIGTGNTAAASGNTVSAPVSVPVNVCGVSIAVLGSARSRCTGGSTAGNPPGNPGGPMIPGGNPPGSGNPPGGGNPPGKHHNPPGKHHKPQGHHKPPKGHRKPPKEHRKPPKGQHKHQNHHGKHGGGTSHGGCPGGKSHGGSHTGPSAGGSSQHGMASTVRTTSTASLASGTLPTTGIDLLGILAAALGCLGTGAGALLARRRRARAQEA
jgi:LPXTG-motif cell wall-anchored protein